MAAMSATLGVGGAIGLPLSAWIADVGDWHALFWVAAAWPPWSCSLTIVVVPHVHDAQSGRLDVVGTLALAVGLVALLVGISKGTTGAGATRGRSARSSAGSWSCSLWGVFELRQDDPLVDLRTSAQLPVLMTNLAAVAVGFGMMAQAIVVPQLLQLPEATGYGLGQSILAAGLWMAPGGLAMMLFAPLSSSLIDRLGARVTLMIGAGVLGGGYLVALFLMGAPWQLLVASCVCAAGRRHRVRRDADPDPRRRADARGRLGGRAQRPDALGRHHPGGRGHGHPADQQHHVARRLPVPDQGRFPAVLPGRLAGRVRRHRLRRDDPAPAAGARRGRGPTAVEADAR